ncbi:MAG: type III-A CRISPR-associated RAMP protein Csm3 [Deltaproteobacteria bacterium]|nr:type III-A CRISPR-associated RAMP protein Csm3 [Deltaproteobacteria bacterium]RLB33312.1 MAG: type III-A CRISPR-associated RAMP protein Csm3 [Deltaproteobacteria bacterium]
MAVKLQKKVFISGTIQAVTGLSVGGSSIGLEIGGADKVVVRNAITNQPYIPGSSLKGKMRSLLEKFEGNMSITVKKTNKAGQILEEKKFNSLKEVPEGYLNKSGDVDKIAIEAMPCKCGACIICQVFGVSAEEEGMPARLIVRDSDLINHEELEKSKNTDMPYTEVKTEVVIDRITAAATPRQFERVPAGAVFGLNLVCNIYEGDDENGILNKVFEGLRLVQDDYLGGSGTRGYGQVKFRIDSVTYKDQDIYQQDDEAVLLQEFTIPKELQ